MTAGEIKTRLDFEASQLTILGRYYKDFECNDLHNEIMNVVDRIKDTLESIHTYIQITPKIVVYRNPNFDIEQHGENLLNIVCQCSGFKDANPHTVINGKTRRRPVPELIKVVSFLLVEFGCTYESIGTLLRRHYSTIICAVQAAKGYIRLKKDRVAIAYQNVINHPIFLEYITEHNLVYHK